MKKYMSFIAFLDHAKITYNEVRIVKQPSYLKRYFDQYKEYYKLYLLGNNLKGNYYELQEQLKDVDRKFF